MVHQIFYLYPLHVFRDDTGEEGESSCEGDGFSIVISMWVKQS